MSVSSGLYQCSLPADVLNCFFTVVLFHFILIILSSYPSFRLKSFHRQKRAAIEGCGADEVPKEQALPALSAVQEPARSAFGVHLTHCV